jgi:F-type H+-transporting ATPase subunit epsilon
MAESSFTIRLVTPQGKLLDGKASYASVPAHDGLIGFQPGRAPIVFKLGLGEMTVTFANDAKNSGGGSRNYLVEDGFGQMVNGKLTVLTSRAIAASDIVEAEAAKELAEAEKKSSAKVEEMDQITRARDRARLKLRLARAAAGKGI